MPDLVDIAEIAESMDEFRATPFEASAWAADTGPAMAGFLVKSEPGTGFEVMGSETVRKTFVLPA